MSGECPVAKSLSHSSDRVSRSVPGVATLGVSVRSWVFGTASGSVMGEPSAFFRDVAGSTPLASFSSRTGARATGMANVPRCSLTRDASGRWRPVGSAGRFHAPSRVCDWHCPSAQGITSWNLASRGLARARQGVDAEITFGRPKYRDRAGWGTPARRIVLGPSADADLSPNGPDLGAMIRR
jgi:hypothetical protein